MLVAACSAARAHSMPNSIVRIEAAERSVYATLTLPVAELQYAYAPARALETALLRPADRAGLAGYVLAHFAARDLGGHAWHAEVIRLQLRGESQQRDVVAVVRLVPAAGPATQPFVLRDDLVTHEVMSHVILVFGRRANAADDFLLLGALQHPNAEITLAAEPAGAWSGFLGALALGVRHLAGGLDHILFLLALILPAPLIHRGGQWGAARSTVATLRQLAVTVTAFTIGHSVTLVIGAFHDTRAALPLVECLVAFSVLIAAMQALRPWLGEREALLALTFGLIHGLSFSAALVGAELSPASRGISLLGFNLGIELAQLGVIVVVAPLLVACARRRSYARVRAGGAVVIAVLALYWLWLRIPEALGTFQAPTVQ
jgi:hypothetical protein